MNDIHEYYATHHDRARDQLRITVFEWCEVSHYMGPGDRFIVDWENHRLHDSTGTVVYRMANEQLHVRMDQRAYDGRYEGTIPRKYIKRIGYS